MKSQIKSKQRVIEHGEVFTPERVVNDMLDLVKAETERIDSRFLEPACGTGNFLVEILKRKLRVVEADYTKSQLDYEKYTVIAVSSIYGIDILEDNILECRKKLFSLFDQKYTSLFEEQAKEQCRCSIRYILERNILWGNSLILNTRGENPLPIIFAEWTLVKDCMIKRRDFKFLLLLSCEPLEGHNLFSDLGENTFIPTPAREYPLMHFLEIGICGKL